MKKLAIIFIIFFISHEGFCQYKSQWRAMHGYEMDTKDSFFGIGISGEYFPLNYFSVVPAFTYFLPATGHARAFDLNVRYYFSEKEKQWYGLLGYGHFTRLFEFNELDKQRFNSLNVGAGGMIKFNDELGINPEIRYQGFNRNDLIFKLSIVYFIN